MAPFSHSPWLRRPRFDAVFYAIVHIGFFLRMFVCCYEKIFRSKKNIERENILSRIGIGMLFCCNSIIHMDITRIIKMKHIFTFALGASASSTDNVEISCSGNELTVLEKVSGSPGRVLMFIALAASGVMFPRLGEWRFCCSAAKYLFLLLLLPLCLFCCRSFH